MTAVELLTKFRSLDVRLWIEGDRLRYSAARGVLTPDLRAELAARKEQIVDLLRSAAALESRTPPPITRVARSEAGLPLSFAQQRLWFLEQLEPGSVQYNIAEAVRLSGQLDHQALERSLNEVVRRHESLRTRFVATGGEARQVIDVVRSMQLAVEEVEGEELPRLLREEAEQPFDLTSGELLRVRLFRLGAEEHVLAATMHHIISDEWSMNVLLRELSELYETYRRGEEAQLPELPVQYADYAVWQREWLQGEVLEEQLGYWREQLAGAPEVLALPTDRQRPAVASHVGAYEEVRIAAETVQGLKRVSREQGATLFMTLLACFQAVLSRWSGETDVVVGTVVAGRERAETEGLVGFFVNTLALRTDLSDEPALAELVARVREVCVGAYAHQEVPFEKLVEELNVTRELSRTPLFQVALVLQNPETESLGLAGLGLQELEVSGEEHRTAKFDLQLSLRERGEEVVGTLEYNVQLYERATVARLARHVERMLAACAVDATQPITTVPLLTEAEREQLLWEWNEPVGEYASDGSVAEEFARQVEARAAAVAVQYEDTALSYSELERRSNQLAHYLRSRGVGAEVRVGLLLERSLELVVSVLGVLKAGGAYVPLEPGLPPERLRYMLEDAECGLLLTTAELRAQVAGWSGPVVTVDGDAEVIAQASAAALPSVVSGANAAYVIYTSGSTGQPKGVVVTHGNILRLLRATQEWFGFGSDDVWTMFHSYAFDFSVWELWGALLYGGRLVVVPYWVSRTPEAFAELLAREQVTVLNQTPSAFRQLASSNVGDGLPVRVIVFGGEALEVGSLRGWYEQQGDDGPQLVNMYGITETTVHVTYRALSAAEVARRRGSVIGWRIPDLQLYILDEHGEPAPVGVGGELYVGGAGLARGYLGRPELTATRFLPHPYSREAGARLYRTGDRGRYLADGDVEYLGRVDQQVKIRGYRIETGEIEAALSAHETVREAVVVARAEGGEQRLVAYVVPRGEADVNELRHYLRERLPDYMVPAHIVQLQQLPLTRNGKLDRGRLPAPQGQEGISAAYEAPRTTTEELLASVWEKVLGVGPVGVADNFFALGGDSIRSVRVVALAREHGLELTLPQLFQHQTLAELAAVVQDSSEIESETATAPFSLLSSAEREQLPEDVEDAYPLAQLQTGMLFHSEYGREAALYHNYASYHLRARFDEQALRQALDRLLRRHAVLRTAFDLTSYSRPLQLVQREVTVPLQVTDLRGLNEDEQERVIAEWQAAEKQREIDWRVAPLLRVQIHRRSEESFQFSFAEHHAILDGWSVAALFTELFADYRALLEGAELPEPSVPQTSFRDFVALEQRALASTECAAYWQQKLSGSSALPLPQWQSDTETEIDSHELAVPLAEELSVGLRRLARQAGVPLKSVLLAAHLRVLSVLGGQKDVLTGVVSHGRPESKDTEQALGLYLNTLPFRLQLKGDSWLELVRETFAAERELLPYRYYPLAQMQVEQGGQALFDTTFNFTHFHVLDAFAGDAQIEVLDETGFAATDITLAADFDVTGKAQRVGLTLTGKAARFSREQLNVIGDYYRRALEALVQTPDARYDAQSLLSAAETERLLVHWNDTARDHSTALSVAQLFEAQAAQTPDATAVIFQTAQLTYAELNRRANQLAHHLREIDAGPEVLVGVCLERSLDLIVSLLAILKTGAAYLPLDPNYPRERVRYILEESRCAILVTQQQLFDRLPAEIDTTTRVLYVDTGGETIAAQPDTNPGSLNTPDSLAYLLYTSGSTGQPKGVMVTTGSLARYVETVTHIYGLNGSDRILQFSSFSFDVHAEELYPCLAQGGTLVLRDEEMLASPQEFLARCRDLSVTIIVLPTAYWHVLTAGASQQDWSNVETLRLVVVGGESASPERVRAFLENTGGRVRLLNSYGPTETTVSATFGELDQQRSIEKVGIGRPIANTQCYVLDESLLPVPIGVAGELLVGGDGVSRGYLNRPELTAERFIPDPFSTAPGARLYRTGDRVQYLPDGNIEYLSRLDQQVKIRGIRIETGEIEAALRTHGAVIDAVVVTREDTQFEKYLVAYVVSTEANPDIVELSDHLRKRLPEYMIPATWVVLDELPLTPNGKVDRRALPDPGESNAQSGQSFVAPRTLIEEVLATIWRQVLGRERIGRTDNFFRLGGHSLLAIQVISRIRESFHVELPVRSMFEAPTLAEYSERIFETMRSGGSLAAPPLKPRPDNDYLPLSYAQQRLWFLDQLMPGSNAYNLPAEMYFDEDVNVGVLEQALTELVRRHEALRTTFVLAGDQPVQRISPPAPVVLPLVDLSHLPDEEKQAEAERLRQKDALGPFDLSAGPLLRATLIRLDQQKHLFLLNMHHIISDGWSMGVLLQEMQALYDAFSRGQASPLPELKIQYADYARWQREWLRGDVLAEEVNYWKQRLEGAPTLLELETDRSQQLQRLGQAANVPVVFSEEVSRALKEFAHAEGATLFMILMAGFHALLRRYTGQDDILVGTPIAGRSRVELEPIIGFFVNMIPIRTTFTDAPTFRDLVEQVRESSFAAYTHDELPFDKLVEEMQPKRAPGRNPIFQAILALENDAPEIEMAKISVPVGAPVSADIRFDLEMHLTDSPNRVAGFCLYSQALYDANLIERMVKHFERFFEKALAEPDTELSALSLLDDAEYTQVVHDWNNTAVAFPESICIHQSIEQEAQERPHAIALEFGDENISYRELNHRANVLAHHLREAGVGSEELVAVMLERSAELVVALIGVAKAGGVYVPVNLTDPPARIRFILEDAGVKVLLTSKRISETLPPSELKTLCVDALDNDIRVENLLNTAAPDSLAYLMYTSGSTGTPKGVCITHRNILALVKSANYAKFGSDETFLQLAPISFDASTFEIWACLLNGGRLVVFPPTTPSLSELGEFVAQRQITTLFLTTGLFHQFVDTNVKSIGAVRQLLTGGDALSPAHLNRAVEQIENCSFVNCYGPTEATVMACCYRVGPDRPAASVPIGRPINNSRVYVLNAMQPAGVGERGELFIGGAGLGRGYYNRPDLTAERFVPDPFGPEPGGRLYRTGDASRYSQNGNIQFLGRVDSQVKISGFRIEPGEIETVLMQHPSLKSVLVVPREDTPGTKRLIAYVTINDGNVPSNEQLRSYARERLPEYMVPAAFVVLDKFPVTAHGKIDKAALPAPQINVSGSGREYVAPVNSLQQQLVDIWEEIFKIHPIGINDDFFELGGHSLMMIMLVARIEERLGKRVSMAELFSKPTIQHLAELIGHGKEVLVQSLLVPMQAQGTKPALFSPHASGGHVWCYKELAEYIGDDQPFFGVQARKPTNGLVEHTKIEEMAADYVEAIRASQPSGPYFLGGWSMGGVIAFEMARQLEQQGEQIALLALIDAHAPVGEQSEHNWALLLSTFALDLKMPAEHLGALLDSIASLPPMTQLRKLWMEARAGGLVPSDMTLVEFRKMFDIFKINANTLESYRPGPYGGRITLFAAEGMTRLNLKRLVGTGPVNTAQTVLADDSEDEVPDIEGRDPLKGWGKLALGGIDLRVVPGDHFSMLQEPHVQMLAQQLRQAIQASKQTRNGSV